METKRLTIAAVLLLVTAFVVAPLLRAADIADIPNWPEHHGPGRTNISPEKGLLKEWPQGGPRKLWTYSQCGKGYSGVTIAEGMIFTAGDFDRQEIVIALDMNGKLVWKQPNGESWRRASPGSRATPTYSDGVVYHMNPTGRLAAYQAKSGKPLWVVGPQGRIRCNVRHLGPRRECDRRWRQDRLHARGTERPSRCSG